jgi:hypothetical protein
LLLAIKFGRTPAMVQVRKHGNSEPMALFGQLQNRRCAWLQRERPKARLCLLQYVVERLSRNGRGSGGVSVRQKSNF